MPFIKYPSIENHYQQKNIDYWLEKYPRLKTETYIAEEKIHGCNIQTIFTPGKNMLVATRNHVLDPDERFFDIWKTLFRYTLPLRELKRWGHINDNYLNVYWEMFGDGIQKGVLYFRMHMIRALGIMINGILQPPSIMQDIFFELGLSYLMAPTFTIVSGLERALDLDPRTPSIVNPQPGNIMEGIVIKPFETSYIDEATGSVFMIKKKNEEFLEKSKQPKPKTINKEVEALNNTFKEYITANRLQNIFSKYGEIESQKQISEYIKYMLDDAKADFFKDLDESEYGTFKDMMQKLNKKDARAVFNVGSSIAKMLKEYL